MGKRKIPFTIIETAVIRSEQLTWSEKRLYISLKTYRHNNPPTRCDPCLETIEKTSGLSHPTVNKAKKSLEIKGLIKYQSGGGRTKTNKYIFTLEDGTDEEKQILLAYLKAKKTGKKLTQFKTKKQGKNEPTLEEKTGLEFNKKQGKNEPTNKKYLTRRKQQQEKPPRGREKKTNPEIKKFIDTYFNDYKNFFNEAPEISEGKDGNLIKQMLTRHSLKNLVSLLPLFWQLKDDLIDKNGHTIGMFKLRLNKLTELRKEKEKRWWERNSSKPYVVASSKQKGKKPKPVVNDNHTVELMTKLQELGIQRDKVVELLVTHLYENIEKQVEWLPYRKNIENPAGALVKAIEDNWPEPLRIAEKIEKRKAIQNTLLRNAEEDLRKSAAPERIKEWIDKLEPEYQKKLKESLKKAGLRGLAERLSWVESEKYRGLYHKGANNEHS